MQATEVSKLPLPPGPANPTETLRFDSKDGTSLYGEWFEAPEARAAALVIHGYAEHGGCYREVCKVLTNAGLSAMVFDLRGSGRSHGQRGYVRKFADYLEDTEAALAELRARAGKSTPVIIVSHSNGALITMRFLADPWRNPDNLLCAVLSSPYLKRKKHVALPTQIAARVLSKVLPSLSLPLEIDSAMVTSDPEKQRQRDLDTLCHDVASVRWFLEAESTQDFVWEFCERIDTPTLWLVSGKDQIADSTQARKVQDRCGGESEYHEFPDMEHEVFNELDRARVYEVMTEYLTRKLDDAGH